MLRVDVYVYGAGVRVRLEHHVPDGEAKCSEDCEEYAMQRCYPERDASPAQCRSLVTAAVADALMIKGLGHQEFLNLVGQGDPLF